MNRLTRQGIALLIVSSDLPEILSVCDRSLVAAAQRRELAVSAEDTEAMTVDFLSQVLLALQADHFLVTLADAVVELRGLLLHARFHVSRDGRVARAGARRALADRRPGDRKTQARGCAGPWVPGRLPVRKSARASPTALAAVPSPAAT